MSSPVDPPRSLIELQIELEVAYIQVARLREKLLVLAEELRQRQAETDYLHAHGVLPPKPPKPGDAVARPA